MFSQSRNFVLLKREESSFFIFFDKAGIGEKSGSTEINGKIPQLDTVQHSIKEASPTTARGEAHGFPRAGTR